MLQWELDMIRICLVGPDIYPDGGEFAKSFAFYSTSSDRFLEFDGDQVFKDWEDFKESWIHSGGHVELARFHSLYEALVLRLSDTKILYEIDSKYDTYSAFLMGPIGADLVALEHEYHTEAPVISFCDWLRSERGFTLPVCESHTFGD